MLFMSFIVHSVFFVVVIQEPFKSLYQPAYIGTFKNNNDKTTAKKNAQKRNNNPNTLRSVNHFSLQLSRSFEPMAFDENIGYFMF